MKRIFVMNIYWSSSFRRMQESRFMKSLSDSSGTLIPLSAFHFINLVALNHGDSNLVKSKNRETGGRVYYIC